jgi:type IV secretory pathway TrbD component
MVEDRNPNLKNKAVFTHQSLVAGIPTKVLISTLLLTAFSAMVFCKYLPLWLGLIISVALALLILVPVYLLHKEDPEAYIVWMRSLWAPSRLTAGRSVRRRMLVLVPQSGGTFKVQPTSKGSKQ